MIPVQIHADGAGGRIGNQLGLRFVERDAQLHLAARQQLHAPGDGTTRIDRRLEERLPNGEKPHIPQHEMRTRTRIRQTQPQHAVR